MTVSDTSVIEGFTREARSARGGGMHRTVVRIRRRMAQRNEAGMGKLGMYSIVAVVAVALMVLGIYLGSLVTDERLALEEKLNARYEETIELNARTTQGQAVDIIVDGELREDCDTTDDGYLECTDDPQPTLTD